MGYHLLHNAARKRTEHYVIEAGVDTEDVVKPELPSELLAILQQSLSSGEVLDLDEQSIPRNKEMSGYLLAWMITFDLFIDAVRICSRSRCKHTILTSDVVNESSFGLFQPHAEPRHRFSIFHSEYI